MTDTDADDTNSETPTDAEADDVEWPADCPTAPDNEDIIPDEVVERYIHPDGDDADEVVALAKARSLVIRFTARIGATPWLRYTPYYNHHGVKIHMWSGVSYTFRAMPERTLLGLPTIIDPRDEGYNVRMLTDEWVWRQVFHSRMVDLVRYRDSPFQGPLFGPWSVRSNRSRRWRHEDE